MSLFLILPFLIAQVSIFVYLQGQGYGYHVAYLVLASALGPAIMDPAMLFAIFFELEFVKARVNVSFRSMIVVSNTWRTCEWRAFEQRCRHSALPSPTHINHEYHRCS